MYLRTLFVGLIMLAAGLFPAPILAQDLCPDIAEVGPGVERIEGQGTYTFFGIPLIVDQPLIALVDGTYQVQGLQYQFAPSTGQVVGQITSDFFSSPFSYTIDLPIRPQGLSLDVDQDGEEDSGPQVFLVTLGQNILNTPRLEEFSQEGLMTSLIVDQETQQILAGSLLLYAPDDAQGFPCAAGEDGVLFTEDDAIAVLPAGYTVAKIDGTEVKFDRSQVAEIDVVEVPGSETPDFSDQGFVESYGSLIDFLRERYVFNNFYDFDWDTLYEKYLPRVEEAEAEDNVSLYYLALFDLGQEFHDAHVYVKADAAGITTPEAIATYTEAFAYSSGGIGAETIELDDGRIIVTSVAPGSPAADAELVFGTEIVSVNGTSVEEALATVRYPYFAGSDASVRYRQVQYLLSTAPGAEVEVGYILPGETDVTTTTFTAIVGGPAVPFHGIMPMEYALVDNFGYVSWPDFLRTGISTHIYADFIKMMSENHVPAIIIDLRGNSGGSDLMEDAVLSYLYSADDPYTHEGTTKFRYNAATGEWISEFEDASLSAPAGATPYLGEVVFLVDIECASACEFLGYGLQRTGRATIIGQYPSVGAGGSTNAVVLPGGILFNYTESTELDDETGMPTFQYVGVQPDIQVPITEATELEKLEGGDPVLAVARAYLHGLELSELKAMPVTFAQGTIATVAPANWQPDPEGVKYTSPDATSSMAFRPFTHTDATEPDAVAAAISEEAEKVGERESDAGTWSLYEMPLGTQFVIMAVITIDETPYVGLLLGDDEPMLAALTVNVLYPALDAFTVME